MFFAMCVVFPVNLLAVVVSRLPRTSRAGVVCRQKKYRTWCRCEMGVIQECLLFGISGVFGQRWRGLLAMVGASSPCQCPEIWLATKIHCSTPPTALSPFRGFYSNLSPYFSGISSLCIRLKYEGHEVLKFQIISIAISVIHR